MRRNLGLRVSAVVPELRREVIDPAVSLSALLWKARGVAQALRDANAEEWISRELTGYSADDGSTYPPYRRVTGQVMGLNPFHGWQPVRFANPAGTSGLLTRLMSNTVPELEADIARGETRGVIEFPPDVEGQLVAAIGLNVQVGLMVPISESVRILGNVRARLHDWVSGLPADETSDETPNRPDDRPYTVNINAPVENLQVAQNSPGSMQTIEGELDLEDVSRFVDRLAATIGALGLDDTLVQELKSDIATIKNQVRSPAPKDSVVRTCLMRAGEIIGGAAASAAVEAIIEEFPKYIPLR